MKKDLLGNNVKIPCWNIIDITPEKLNRVCINAIYFRIIHLEISS